jgi:hypothetical protein
VSSRQRPLHHQGKKCVDVGLIENDCVAKTENSRLTAGFTVVLASQYWKSKASGDEGGCCAIAAIIALNHSDEKTICQDCLTGY